MLIGYARVCGRLMHQRPVLEVVRETQAHVPERAGVGQQLPRDGFAYLKCDGAIQLGVAARSRVVHPSTGLTPETVTPKQ